jgi:hypothetical protein
MNPELLQYFASPTAAAEFALLHTEGETRQQLLGVTRQHYKSETVAIKWHLGLPLDLSQEANQEARNMFAEMIAR